MSDKDFRKHLDKIRFENSGDAFWGLMAITPLLDGLFEEQEKHVIVTQIPRYLGQMRDVGASISIDNMFRPFDGLNAEAWPELFEYVSEAWDLPSEDEDGEIVLVSMPLDDEEEQRLLLCLQKYQKAYNDFFDNFIQKIIDKHGLTEGSREDTRNRPIEAAKLLETYVNHLAAEVHKHFKTDKNRRDFLLAAVCLLASADGDYIGMEKFLMISLFAKFKIPVSLDEISYERFNNFSIPTVIETFSPFENNTTDSIFSYELIKKNLKKRNAIATFNTIMMIWLDGFDEINSKQRLWLNHCFKEHFNNEEVETLTEEITDELNQSGIDPKLHLKNFKTMSKQLFIEIGALILANMGYTEFIESFEYEENIIKGYPAMIKIVAEERNVDWLKCVNKAFDMRFDEESEIFDIVRQVNDLFSDIDRKVNDIVR